LKTKRKRESSRKKEKTNERLHNLYSSLRMIYVAHSIHGENEKSTQNIGHMPYMYVGK
jgi:hypothetical protein